MAIEIITRSEAKSNGLVRYFTGNPCKHGHIAERQTSNGGCIKCRYEIEKRWIVNNQELHRTKLRRQAARYRRDDPERIRRIKRNWELRNPDKVYEKGRRWSAANPERKRAHNKKWQDANKDKVRIKNKSYKTLHKERLRPIAIARTKQWQANNPEKHRANSRKARHTRRARIYGAGGSYTNKQIAELLEKQNCCCAACAASLKEKRELDHIIAIARGGSNDISNLQWLCPPCNRSKGAKDYALWAQENHIGEEYNASNSNPLPEMGCRSCDTYP